MDRLSERVVRSQGEILDLMARGAENRATGATKLNDVSSRSHAVFIVIVEHSQSAQAKPPDNLEDMRQAVRHMNGSIEDLVPPEQPVTIKV